MVSCVHAMIFYITSEYNFVSILNVSWRATFFSHFRWTLFELMLPPKSTCLYFLKNIEYCKTRDMNYDDLWEWHKFWSESYIFELNLKM